MNLPTNPHRSPFDPLSPDEISRAVALAAPDVRTTADEHVVCVSTGEPARDGSEDERRFAEVIVHDRGRRDTRTLRVDLDAGTVDREHVDHGVQPAMTTEEFLGIQQAVRDAPEFRRALERRGVDDLSLVDIDPVSAGDYGLPEEQGGRRLARILAYVRPEPGGNAYARPLEGVFGLVDVHTGELVHFEDRDPVPLPAETGEFRADRIALRDDVRPIHISQPEGPSFTVHGHEIRWQKWRMNVGFSMREGLVLHRIGYEDDGRLRPVLHRASFAEMVVPYADPDRFYQTPLDIGEFNIGTMTNSLTLGCDCLGVIHYFDAAYSDANGEPVVVPNAICLHEEDDGLLWKHTDFRTGQVEVRRGRRLVVSSIVTVGNYEYGFFWYFQQDGSISAEVKATGIVATQAVTDDATPAYAKLVAPNLAGIHHQHIFCARLDFALDGGRSTVMETETVAIPQGPENPHGNAWTTVSRPLSSELEARRNIDITTARSWTVVNPETANAVGQPVGYRLVTGENTVPFFAPGSSGRRRAAFMDHHLWVTRYAADERFPAGEYPYQHAGGDGLPRWVEADRSLENEDLVVWYTMNHHHVPRPEDWPVMPVARLGFTLKPWGFFDRSPALDVPPTQPGEGSRHATDACCKTS